MADNIVQEVNSPNILVITDSDQNQITVTQPLTNTIEVATPGPQGVIGSTGPAGPTGSSTPFTKISGSSSWFTTSSIQLTGSLQGTASYAVAAGTYLYLGNSSVTSSISWSQASVQELNLDSNPTLTFSNGVLGQTSTLLLKQTEGGQKTITWPSNVLWSGGVAPSMQTLIAPGPGLFDPTLVTGTGFNANVLTIDVQSDSKIILGGSFSSYNGFVYNHIIRLNSDGTQDITFNIGTGFNGTVNIVAIQPDGKILVGGVFNTYNGISTTGIIRLNSDGTIDNTFSTVEPDAVYMVLQSDGKIIVSTQSNTVVRLNSDGSPDPSWTPGSGPNNTVYAITIQPDGKILIGGNFSTYNSVPRSYITRLNSNGTLDSGFASSPAPNGGVWTIGLQSSGKIILGGVFNDYGSNIGSIIRLNSSGTVDSTFTQPGASPTDGFTVPFIGINKVLVQNDDKIIVTGVFTAYTKSGVVTTNLRCITRLNSDGTMDTSFVTGTGLKNSFGGNGIGFSLAFQPENKLLVGGNFASYNDNSTTNIVRIDTVSSPAPTSYNRVTFDYNGTDYIGSF